MAEKIPQTTTDEIKLQDILGFIRANLRRAIIFVVAGLLISIIYFLWAPKKYDATWQIRMARVGTSPIESADVLTQRLRIPSTYSASILQACALAGEKELGDYLGGALEVKYDGNDGEILQLRFRAASIAQAKQCADAITEMISVQQHNLVENSLAASKELLVRHKQALLELRGMLAKKQDTHLGEIEFLMGRDRINQLEGRIDALEEKIIVAQSDPTRQLTPIFIPNEPASPKVKQILPLGLVLGLILGVLYFLWIESKGNRGTTISG